MKICALSDIHGQINNVEVESCELLFVCGDIVPLNIQTNTNKSFWWFKKEFVPWCSSKFKHVYLIGGNHDFFLEEKETAIKNYLEDSNITLLNNEGAIYSNSEKTIKIWGSPMCHIFGNWAFMYDDEYEEKMFNKMPDEFDILLTHDAPYGVSDVLLQKNVWWADGSHIGNQALAKVMIKKNIKYNFHGHLHSSSRKFELLGNIKVVNCSLLDEYYNKVYNPIYVDL